MIDPNKVQEILLYSLAGNPDNINLIEVQGTMRRFGLDSAKLEDHRDDVIDMLKQLDEAFFETGGGGMSLMSMVADKNGDLWGQQFSADELFVLAAGLGLAKFTFPREMWQILPGAMPYITIFDTKWST